MQEVEEEEDGGPHVSEEDAESQAGQKEERGDEANEVQEVALGPGTNRFECGVKGLFRILHLSCPIDGVEMDNQYVVQLLCRWLIS